MTDTEQKHTPGPMTAYPEALGHGYWQVGAHHGANVVASCIHQTPVTDAEANARLLAASYNAFDSAAARLGLNAVELAERMQDGGVAELVEALNLAKQQMIQTGVVFALEVMQKIDVALVKAGAQ